MNYTVKISPAAQRQIKKLPAPVQLEILSFLTELQSDPRPPGVKKMVGEENLYRIRAGKYRILYEIYAQVLLIVVAQVGQRSDIYRTK